MVKLDVSSEVRHGTSLIIRNIVLKVADQDIYTLIIGRRVLESLECNNRDMLMASRDEFGNKIDVKKRLKEYGNEEKQNSTIAALHVESVFTVVAKLKMED